ncbi:hypothetical protein CMI47_19030 [Candidatus Pacearchaeota archaeon]|nr:hypothetical protein [Candidatus Pacearchaeota archaeon]|tara:strand:- start:6593 stop:7135 length:543 start_codon:yes stop_codon:yes gene_type:complete
MLTTIFSLFLAGCSESVESLIKQSQDNSGQYTYNSWHVLSSPDEESFTSIRVRSRTEEDSTKLESAVKLAGTFAAQRLSTSLADCKDGHISFHVIPNDILNNKDVVVINDDEDSEFFGLTQFTYSNKAFSFICSDCTETVEDIFLHEITHFFYSQCGILPEKQDESNCHDMVAAYRMRDL